MQNSINLLFEKIFTFLTDVLGRFVSDPGTKWGLAIILFTVLFNLLVFPLNWKSMVSTKKMGDLQPELKKLQDKYKNDPQKYATMQQQLMKANNASMLGGCLPILITWPLFIAMINVFRVLSTNGTLTDLSFTPIIPDLSAVKNIPLTVLTVLATVLQQLVLEMGKSPEAKKQSQNMMPMNIMMTGLMGWIAYSQPAALGLYWVASTLFRVVQQVILNNIDKNSEASALVTLEEVERMNKTGRVK